MKPFVEALSTGYSTNTRKTEKRISDFLNDCEEISDMLVGGEFPARVQAFKRETMCRLRKGGCTITRNKNDKWVVKLPEGSK